MNYNPKLDPNFQYQTNKYSKWYFNIIQSALTFNQTRKTRKIYVENHHIFPTKLGGPNISENKVFLSAREHFICHILLTRCLTGLDRSKMIFAAFSMKRWNKDYKSRKINSKIYEKLRIDHTRLMSVSQKGRIISPEHRKKLSNANLGKTHSTASIMKMSIALKGQKRSEETRKKMSIAFIGRKLSSETCQKISKSKTGTKLSAEIKQKLSIAAKGKSRPSSMFTDQWRQLQRTSHIGRKDTSETFLKKSIAQAGMNNPRSLTWIVQKEVDSTTFEVKSLKPWCKSLNLNNDTLTSTLKSKKFYKGYRILLKF